MSRHGRFKRLLLEGAGNFLSYFLNFGISKHRFDRLCVGDVEQARAELCSAVTINQY